MSPRTVFWIMAAIGCGMLFVDAVLAGLRLAPLAPAVGVWLGAAGLLGLAFFPKPAHRVSRRNASDQESIG